VWQRLSDDMQVDGNITGNIDFSTLADVIHMDSTYMEGLLETNLDFGGKLSFIEKEQYGAVQGRWINQTFAI